MLDDPTLDRLMTDALDDVPVPAGGPDRVLAARDQADRPGHRWTLPNRRVLAVSGAVAVIVLALAGVVGLTAGHGSNSTSTSSGGTSSGGAIHRMSAPGLVPAGPAAAGSGSTTQNGLEQGPSSNGAAGGVSKPVTPPGAGSGSTPTGPGSSKIVQQGSLTLTVGKGKVGATVHQLGSVATSLGGSVTHSSEDDAASGATADVTLEVPSGAFTTLVGRVEAVGQAGSVDTSADDQTSTAVDLAARIGALQATEQQLLGVLGKAETVTDILAVQAQITPVQTQIEQLQGQQETLDHQTSTASLAVHVQEHQAPQPPIHHAGSATGMGRAWRHTTHDFTGGIEDVVSGLGTIAVIALCLAAIGAMALGARRVVRRYS